MRSASRRQVLGVTLAGVSGGGLAAWAFAPGLGDPVAVRLDEGRIPTLAGATAWLQSPPLAEADLRGKVVLINFWTYTCINWLRSLPRVRAWDAKYRRHGLVTIGVHTPEFDFEKDLANVRRAVAALGVAHPVAVDSDAAIWRAFGNAYWPALYFVDARGRIRHHHFGEGAENTSEQVIRGLLSEAGAGDLGRELASTDGHGIEAPADWAHLGSQENYLGHERTLGFSPAGAIVVDRPKVYTASAALALDAWSLEGRWTMTRSFVALDEPGGRLTYRFHARDLHLVMSPASAGLPLRFRVRLEGQAPQADHGLDVDEGGFGTVTEPRLYQLVRQRGRIADRLFDIQFIDAGVRVYSVTFG